MPKPYSIDLRARVIEAVAGGASRREAAEDYAVAASTVVLCATLEATERVSAAARRRWRSTRNSFWRWLPNSRT